VYLRPMSVSDAYSYVYAGKIYDDSPLKLFYVGSATAVYTNYASFTTTTLFSSTINSGYVMGAYTSGVDGCISYSTENFSGTYTSITETSSATTTYSGSMSSGTPTITMPSIAITTTDVLDSGMMNVCPSTPYYILTAPTITPYTNTYNCHYLP
jgi:hypothetical protein